MAYIKKTVNADFIFKTNTKIRFVSLEDAAEASDELSDAELDTITGKESDQSCNPE